MCWCRPPCDLDRRVIYGRRVITAAGCCRHVDVRARQQLLLDVLDMGLRGRLRGAAAAARVPDSRQSGGRQVSEPLVWHAPNPPSASRPVPSRPVPSRPAPSPPVPSRPVPSRPVPSRPVPSRPVPSRPAPPRPAPSRPAPFRPAPSRPALPRPVPSRPVPSRPVPYVINDWSTWSNVNWVFTVCLLLYGSVIQKANTLKER